VSDSEQAPPTFPVLSNGVAIHALKAPEDCRPVGIDGNELYMEDSQGHTRKIEMPVWENQPCSIDSIPLRGNNCGLIPFDMIRPDPEGDHLISLDFGGGGGTWWLIIQARKPNEFD